MAEPIDDFPRDSWVLLRVMPDEDDIPGAIRMRQALKVLLRSFKIKCVRMTGVGPPEDAGRPNDG